MVNFKVFYGFVFAWFKVRNKNTTYLFTSNDKQFTQTDGMILLLDPSLPLATQVKRQFLFRIELEIENWHFCLIFTRKIIISRGMFALL